MAHLLRLLPLNTVGSPRAHRHCAKGAQSPLLYITALGDVNFSEIYMHARVIVATGADSACRIQCTGEVSATIPAVSS